MKTLPTLSDRRHVLFLAVTTAFLAGCSTPVQRTRTSVSTPPTARPSSALALDTSVREAAVARAMLVVNTPYRYGGNTPEGGFDCSGLVQYVFNDAGSPRLPRSTAQWAAASAPVPEANMQRGDLVFFNTSGQPFSHMGIYVGNGQFVHAPSSGGTVRKDSLSSRYFATRYLGARSVFAQAGSGG
ncbi:C40 family peptidase [Ottowia thiooxydans]|uniref:C40 family peptidase n=1 Tax=Ottowia thiooxydans TaxID=219182 RepID=UPI000687118C|nr:C40 family peptidase [Ottowia thiooxydans]